MEWKPYLFKEQPLFDRSVFDAYQTAFQVQFPLSYAEVITAHQGKVPVKTLFPYHDKSGENETVMGPLFHFVENSPVHMGYNIMENYKLWINRLPAGILPFSEDPGGWQIAFDFRTNKTEPNVVLVNADSGDNNLAYVADDFSIFLHSLAEA